MGGGVGGWGREAAPRVGGKILRVILPRGTSCPGGVGVGHDKLLHWLFNLILTKTQTI